MTSPQASLTVDDYMPYEDSFLGCFGCVLFLSVLFALCFFFFNLSGAIVFKLLFIIPFVFMILSLVVSYRSNNRSVSVYCNTELIASGKTNKPIMVPLTAGEGKVYTVKWDNLSLNVEMSGDTYYMIKKTDFGWRCFCEHL